MDLRDFEKVPIHLLDSLTQWLFYTACEVRALSTVPCYQLHNSAD